MDEEKELDQARGFGGAIVKDRLERAMAYIKELGADYGDIRLKDIAIEEIKMENGKLTNLTNSRSRGVGIRVYVDGAMGFAAASDAAHIEVTAKLAYDTALASATLLNNKARLSPKKAVQAEYSTPVAVDPFTVPLEQKVGLLAECSAALSIVSNYEAYMDFRKEDVIFADTDGAYIAQTFYQSGGGIAARAVSGSGGGSDTQQRSYGNVLRAGYEAVIGLDLPGHSETIAREAIALSEAEDCPGGEFDLILMPTQLQLQIHESVGHPTELDRVLGSEAAFAGASFLSPESAGLKYGSEHVTIVADAVARTGATGLGTFAYDDEGVPGQCVTLIDKGIFKDFQTSRDNAPGYSHGMGLADGWVNLPIVRMTNINLQPGDFTFDELLAGVEYGLLLEENKSWSIDDKRVNFQFACEIAREIKGGELTGKIFKNPIYTGKTTEFWGSCDGVCGPDFHHMIGVPNCGKGQPMQIIRCGHASAPARFRKVRFING